MVPPGPDPWPEWQPTDEAETAGPGRGRSVSQHMLSRQEQKADADWKSWPRPKIDKVESTQFGD